MIGSDPTIKELNRDRFITSEGPAFRVELEPSAKHVRSAITIYLPNYRPRNFIARLRQVDSVPWWDRKFAPSRTPLRARHQGLYWDYEFSKLAFPEDGDILEAQNRATVFQSEAEKVLRLSRHMSWGTSRIPPRYLLRHMVPLLIGALARSARSALHLMLLMQDLSSFRENMKRDCILYIGKVYRQTIETDPAIREMYDRQIERAFGDSQWPDVMPQSLLLASLNHSSLQKCRDTIDSVLNHYDPVPLPLLKVMIDYYTEQKLPKEALGILSRIAPEDLVADAPSFYGRFHNLIKIDTVEESSSGLNFQLLPALVATGIPLTEGLHNEVLERAITLELPDVAWEVYRFMEGNSITVDSRRHLALLRSCFKRSDLDGLSLIMSNIHKRPDLVKDPFLVSYTMNIVRYVCHHQRKLPVSESLAHILAVYDRVYDRAPLVKLAITDALPASEPGVTLVHPDGIQLAFTLWTYVLVQHSDHRVSHFWLQFIHLVNLGEPEMCAAACHDVLYNGFISYWCRDQHTLINAVEVLEEMERLGLCAPSEHTWILLISGFMRHGQESAAENIRQMMKSRGVNPDSSHWKYLLKHYSDSAIAAHVEAELSENPTPSWQNDHWRS